MKPLILYCSISWTGCNKDNVKRTFRLQKHCSRVILDTEPCHSTIDLFKSLGWLPFYLESDAKKCTLAYKHTVGETPEYINSMLKLNSEEHIRTQSAHLIFITPCHVRERGAGHSFTVTACKYWNNLPINLRYCASTNVFKRGLHKQFPTFLHCNS